MYRKIFLLLSEEMTMTLLSSFSQSLTQETRDLIHRLLPKSRPTATPLVFRHTVVLSGPNSLPDRFFFLANLSAFGKVISVRLVKRSGHVFASFEDALARTTCLAAGSVFVNNQMFLVRFPREEVASSMEVDSGASFSISLLGLPASATDASLVSLLRPVKASHWRVFRFRAVSTRKSYAWAEVSFASLADEEEAATKLLSFGRLELLVLSVTSLVLALPIAPP